MEKFTSVKIKDILNQEYNFKIYKIIDSYMEFNKTYMAFVYWKTNRELDLITDDDKQSLKKIFVDYFEKKSYIPNEIQDITLYFDSDENVQKKYKGNYFYATR